MKRVNCFLILPLIVCYVASNMAGPLADCGPSGNKEYIIFSANLSWHEAGLYCKAKGMQLATVNSAAEQQQLFKLVDDKFIGWLWISGNNLDDQAKFVWHSTGCPIVYTSWVYGDEPPVSDNERCVASIGPIADWVLSECDIWRFPICEKYLS